MTVTDDPTGTDDPAGHGGAPSAGLGGLPAIDVSCFATGLELPSPEADAVAATIDRTCREIGFLLVRGHGVRDETKQGLLDRMREFFDLPLAEKQRIAIGNSPYHRGYIAIGAEDLDGALPDHDPTVTYGVGDQKETIDSGVEHSLDHPEVVAGTPLHGPNQLPDLPGFREAWQAYFDEAVEAVLRVQRGLAMALGLAPDFFEALPGHPMYHLRMIHYPPKHAVDGRLLGCGAHTDYGLLTLLAEDGVGGLEVRLRDGSWISATVPPGHLVVNLADMLAIWTNDRYVSNPHRVVNPPDAHRYSIPLFVTPPYHLRVECLPTCLAPGEAPRHEPLVSGTYLQGRFDGTHSYRNPLDVD